MVKKQKRNGFWGRFDDLMDSLPGYIDEQVNNDFSVVQSGDNSVNTVGRNNRIFSNSSSKSVTVTNGMKIVSETKNGKSKITVNGEEVVPKKFADDLLAAVEHKKTFYGETTYAYKHMVKSVKEYKKYLEKRK
jgi:hypothetical protein